MIMDIQSYQITDELRIEPLDTEQAVKLSRSRKAKIWLDIRASDPVDLEEWLERLEVRGLSRRLCLEARDRPAFYPIKDELLLVIPLLYGSGDSSETDHMVFLCREDLLLTMHSRPILSVNEISELQREDSWLPERSIAGLVSALLIGMSFEHLDRNTKIRNSVLALIEQMDRDPDDIEVEDIMDMRSDLMSLGTVVSDQLPAIQALSSTDKNFFNLKEAAAYINCALVNLQSVDRSMDWLDQRVGDLLNSYNMHSQEKTNRRLGRLTILSTIFMPSTLLAGIWGMNFKNMPELGLQFGYLAALCFMAFIGTGMYLLFRRRGWFE